MWWKILFLIFIVLTALVSNYAAVRMINDKTTDKTRANVRKAVVCIIDAVALAAITVAAFAGPFSLWASTVSFIGLGVSLLVPLVVFIIYCPGWSILFITSVVLLGTADYPALVLFVLLLFLRGVSYRSQQMAIGEG